MFNFVWTLSGASISDNHFYEPNNCRSSEILELLRKLLGKPALSLTTCMNGDDVLVVLRVYEHDSRARLRYLDNVRADRDRASGVQRRPLSGHLDLSRRPLGTQVGVGRGMNRPCTFFVVGGMNRVPFSWVAWWPPVQLQEIFFLWFPQKKKIFFLWCMPSLLQPYLICTRRNMFKQAIEYQSSLFCSTTSKTLQFPIFCI